MAPKPGQILFGKYRIIEELGRGGMGVTYQAESIKPKRRCVLKTILRHEVNDQDLQRLDNEAQIMADFKHPHLPAIYDYDFEGNRPYIVMEYIEGTTLYDKTNITFDEALAWLIELLNAIHHIHQKDIIHRDIHPGNICIQAKTNQAFLLDFGIARRLDSTHTELFLKARNRNFAPIEQYSPDQLIVESLEKVAHYVRGLQKNNYHTSYYTDVYALAATFYYVLTGRFATSPGMRVLDELLKPPHEVNPHIPRTLSDMLTKALELHPRDRYQTAQQMLTALQQKGEKPSPEFNKATPVVIHPEKRRVVAGIELIYVPAGEFLMGSDDSELIPVRSNPRHLVRLDTYYIGRYPVTNREYQKFIDANVKQPVPTSDLSEAQPYCWNPITRRYPPSFENHPVVLISWRDALAYCQWLSQEKGHYFRLPSEAEWEKAAGWDMTTSSNRRFPWGPEFENGRCHIGHKQLSPVGQYSPGGDSPYGLTDMAGLIWQWTRSYYWRYPYNLLDRRDKEDYDGRRVSRGGAFNEPPFTAHCAWRTRFAPSTRQPNLGFRLVCDERSLPPRSTS